MTESSPTPSPADSPATPGTDAARLALLNEIVRIAMQDLDLEPMLQRITDMLARSFEWEFVACVSIDLDRNRFVCRALTTSLSTTITPGYSRAIGSGVVGQVARSGEPVVLDDVTRSPVYVETTPGVVSEICVPIKSSGRVVALLNVESLRPGAFAGQLPLLQAIAEHVASAIANARLYETLRRRASDLLMMSEISKAALETSEINEVLERVTRYVHSKFGFSVTTFLLANDDGSAFTLAARQGAAPLEVGAPSWPASVGIVGRAMRTGQRQLVFDVRRDPDYVMVNEDVAAEYAIPATFRGRALGVLDVESRDIETFSRENLLILDTLVDQVAGAIYLATMNSRLAATSSALEETNRRLHEANLQLQLLSTIDSLTGVANRRRFDEALDIEWRRAMRFGTPVSLMMVDVDHFKTLNDRYGHLLGDECLAAIARVLNGEGIRAGDLLARYGGEEFALLTASDSETALGLAELLRQRVERLGSDPGVRQELARITVSVGVATVTPSPGESPSRLVSLADRALYRAKAQGRNRVVAWNAQND